MKIGMYYLVALVFGMGLFAGPAVSSVQASSTESQIESQQIEAGQDNDIIDENEEAGVAAGIAWYWWPVIIVPLVALLAWLVRTSRRKLRE